MRSSYSNLSSGKRRRAELSRDGEQSGDVAATHHVPRHFPTGNRPERGDQLGDAALHGVEEADERLTGVALHAAVEHGAVGHVKLRPANGVVLP
jgi:hypothetical protein